MFCKVIVGKVNGALILTDETNDDAVGLIENWNWLFARTCKDTLPVKNVPALVLSVNDPEYVPGVAGIAAPLKDAEITPDVGDDPPSESELVVKFSQGVEVAAET